MGRGGENWVVTAWSAPGCTLEVMHPHMWSLEHPLTPAVPLGRSSDELGAFLLSGFCSRAPYTCACL